MFAARADVKLATCCSKLVGWGPPTTCVRRKTSEPAGTAGTGAGTTAVGAGLGKRAVATGAGTARIGAVGAKTDAGTATVGDALAETTGVPVAGEDGTPLETAGPGTKTEASASGEETN